MCVVLMPLVRCCNVSSHENQRKDIEFIVCVTVMELTEIKDNVNVFLLIEGCPVEIAAQVR